MGKGTTLGALPARFRQSRQRDRQTTMSTFAKSLLQKELKRLTSDPDSNFFIELVADNLFEWTCAFPGPEGSLYEGGYLTAVLKFPDDFPNHPPKMTFSLDLFHPNIYPSGEVCISILHEPGEDASNPQESAQERWRPIWTVEAILVSVISLLSDPNLDSPANIDAAVKLKESPEEYKRVVRRLAEKSLE